MQPSVGREGGEQHDWVLPLIFKRIVAHQAALVFFGLATFKTDAAAQLTLIGDLAAGEVDTYPVPDDRSLPNSPGYSLCEISLLGVAPHSVCGLSVSPLTT